MDDPASGNFVLSDTPPRIQDHGSRLDGAIESTRLAADVTVVGDIGRVSKEHHAVNTALRVAGQRVYEPHLSPKRPQIVSDQQTVASVCVAYEWFVCLPVNPYVSQIKLLSQIDEPGRDVSCLGFPTGHDGFEEVVSKREFPS